MASFDLSYDQIAAIIALHYINSSWPHGTRTLHVQLAMF
jgi:hypothetical protein